MSALDFVVVVVVVVVKLGVNTIFQHTNGYVLWPVILVEEEPGLKPKRLYWQAFSHTESETRTRADSGEMAVIRNGERFRPLCNSGLLSFLGFDPYYRYMQSYMASISY